MLNVTTNFGYEIIECLRRQTFPKRHCCICIESRRKYSEVPCFDREMDVLDIQASASPDFSIALNWGT